MIKENLLTITKTIASIKKKMNIPYDIQIMGVSKTVPLETIQAAMEAGVTLFGENKIQDAFGKFTDPSLAGKVYSLHFIGHLQRNKVARAIEIASMIESVYKLETLDKIEAECEKQNKKIDYLIQINSSYASQKHGLLPERYREFLDEMVSRKYKNCNLRGLMTVGPFTEDKGEIRKAFRSVHKLFQETVTGWNKEDFDTLSMGMSDDYEIAIEEGSTLVRIGSLLFGRRDYP